MFRKTALAFSVSLSLALVASVAVAADRGGEERFQPGAIGVGDPYFPMDGNGGYDVQHYGLDLAYHPGVDRLSGVARIEARTKQDLSAFNLDFDGLRIHSITVNGVGAGWNRAGGELTVLLRGNVLHKGQRFTTVVRYDGVPRTLDDFGVSGFFHTDDGAIIAGQPHGAATWFPVNDHPTDQAAYTFNISVPRGLEVVANGALVGRRTQAGWSTWTWRAMEPMASYLATVNVGQFDLSSYRADGIRYWDAIDPDLVEPPKPRTGEQYALSQKTGDGPASYKRLARTISVPGRGAQLSFWVTRDTEPNWDFMFVEARTVGENDSTTLADLNGHTSDDTGFGCPYWLGLHPFLRHYQSDNGDDTCAPTGSTGEWHAASGASDGYERWRVDLSDYAGDDVRVSISYASDDFVQLTGLFVDDIVVSTGAGTTSFEGDGNTFDGWTVPGAPRGSAPNPNDWIVGTAEDAPATLGEVANGSFARQPEIIGFLAGAFGPYPFSTAGGIVDDEDRLGFALETQTRPIYSKAFFTSPESGDSVVVHELAHQWYGDSLAVARWRHIWLNEGFATYAEWIWSEREGLGTAQEVFDFFYGVFPSSDPFWDLRIGNPGPDHLFDFPVYARGAMTLHQLRLKVGDGDFFTILRRWATTRAGDNVHTGQFVRLAERVSGEELNRFFRTWLFEARKPGLPGRAADRTTWSDAPAAAQALMQRLQR